MHTHTQTNKSARAHTCFLCHTPGEKWMHQLLLQAALGESKVVTQQSDKGARRAGGRKVEVGFGEAGRGNVYMR